MPNEHTILFVDRLFTGETNDVVRDAVIVIDGSRIEAVGPRDSVAIPEGTVSAQTHHVNSKHTVVPGLIDSHSHMIMPGDGTPYQQLFSQDDAHLALQASANAQIALRGGVTTLVDTGSRGRVLFSLRDAAALGLALTPRLLLSGPPITRTGGHCWFLGGEADGSEGMRSAVRKLNKEGADFIKFMATGGGTMDSYPFRPSLTHNEVSALVDEAQAMGKKTVVHSSAIEGTRRAVSAGVDIVFHCHFYLANGELCYDEELVEQITTKGIYVNPTLWVNRVHVDRLQERADNCLLTSSEMHELEARKLRYEGQVRNVGRLIEAGVSLIAGSDAGWGLTSFDDIKSELECMVEAGLSPVDALLSTTREAARAFGVDDTVGTLQPGKQADLVVVEGDPANDISALRLVKQVMLAGEFLDGRAS